MRVKANVDKNQKQIVAALRSVGAKVLHTHQLKNCFDVLVGFRGEWFAMEIKDGTTFPATFRRLTSAKDKEIFLRSTLTEGERKFYDECKALGLHYIIAYSKDSAIQGIGANRPKFNK